VKKRLSQIAEIRTGLVLSRFKAKEGSPRRYSYPLVGLRCFAEGSTLDPAGVERFETDREPDEKYLTRAGDLLVRLRTPLKALYITEDEAGYLYPSLIAAIRLKDEDLISPKYLLHSLHSSSVFRQLSEKIKGTRIPTIRTADLAALEIVIPPRREQERVLAYLEAAEREARLMEELKSARRELARALLDRSIKKYEER